MPRNQTKTIAAMTKDDLARFVAQAVFNSPANLPPSLTSNELEATELLTVGGDIQLSDQAIASLKAALGLP